MGRLLRDHLGSVRELTDGSGVVSDRYEYDPYGRRTKVLGSEDAGFVQNVSGHGTRLHQQLHRAENIEVNFDGEAYEVLRLIT